VGQMPRSKLDHFVMVYRLHSGALYIDATDQPVRRYEWLLAPEAKPCLEGWRWHTRLSRPIELVWRSNGLTWRDAYTLQQKIRDMATSTKERFLGIDRRDRSRVKARARDQKQGYKSPHEGFDSILAEVHSYAQLHGITLPS